ncbi:MAG TPA: sigma-70 family RNA polymerase sigma factor [Ktedonobacterales bacterium]|jgi:RNA polymerase sigma-70 factor (ECF subfamily)
MNEPARQPDDMPDKTAIQRTRPGADPSGSSAALDDLRLVEALRNGDEAAFMTLINQYHMPLLRLAMLYVPERSLAEEVLQDTWIGVLQGIHRFEGRSSLKTWIFRILMNRARTLAQREGRSVPFSSLAGVDNGPLDGGIEADRFLPADHPQSPGSWASFPPGWEDVPEDHLLSQETRGRIDQAVQALPASQREVITLHDIEGCSSEEVCSLLGISAVNQRVLLHRARSQVRRALEQYFKEE